MERLKNMPESSEGFPSKPPEKRLFQRGGKPLGTKPREVIENIEAGQTIAGGAPLFGEKKPEQVAQVPLFEQIAAELKEKGTFQRDLTGQDVAGIMSGVVESLVSGWDKVEAGIKSMSVNIERQQGTVSGVVEVKKPISATIGVDWVLANDNMTPGKLKLVRLGVTEQAGFFAKTLLRFANIQDRAKEELSDPNKALTKVFAAQLEPQGVKLTGADLQFKETTLLVSLRGEPIAGGALEKEKKEQVPPPPPPEEKPPETAPQPEPPKEEKVPEPVQVAPESIQGPPLEKIPAAPEVLQPSPGEAPPPIPPTVAPPEVPPPPQPEDRNWFVKPEELAGIKDEEFRKWLLEVNALNPRTHRLPKIYEQLQRLYVKGAELQAQGLPVEKFLEELETRFDEIEGLTTKKPAKKEKEKSPEELEEEIWAEIGLRMKGPQRFEYIPDVTKDNIEDPIKSLPKERREILTRQFEAIKALRRMTTAVGTGELRGAEFSKLMETASELKPEHLSTLMRFTRNGEAKIENGRLVLESGDELLVARPFLYYEKHTEDILSAENEADRIRLKNQGRIPQSDKELVANEIAWLLWNFMLEAPYFDLGSDSQKRSLWDKGIKSWTKIFNLRRYCVADGKQYVGNPNMPGDRNIFDYFKQGENHAELNPPRFLKWIDTKKVLDHFWRSSTQPDWLTGQPETTEKLEDSDEVAKALAGLDFGVKGDSPFTRYYSELKKREKTADTLIALIDSFTGHGSPLAKAFALKDAYENFDPNDPKKKEEKLKEIFYFLGVAAEVRKAYYTSGLGADRGTPEKPKRESLMALEADVQKGFFAERYYAIWGINPMTLGTEKEFLMPGTITPEKAAQILLSFKTEDGKPLGQFLREDLLPPEKDESELTMPILVPEAAVAYYRRKGPAEKKDNADVEFIELLKHLADPESYPQVSNPQRLQKLRAKMEKEFGPIITLGDFYEKFFRSPLKNKVGWRGTLLGLCPHEQNLLEEARGIVIADEWFKPKEDDVRKSLFRALIGKKLVSEEGDWVLAHMLDEFDESHRIYGNKTILWPYEDGISKVERIAICYSRDNPRLKMLMGKAKRERIIRKRNLKELIKTLVATGNLSSSDGETLKARLDQDIDFMLYEGIRRKSAKNMFDKNPGLLLELFR